MTSYQYRKPHCGDKTILRPSYLHNGLAYTGKTTSLYWIRTLITSDFRHLNITPMWCRCYGEPIHPFTPTMELMLKQDTSSLLGVALLAIFFLNRCYRSAIIIIYGFWKRWLVGRYAANQSEAILGNWDPLTAICQRIVIVTQTPGRQIRYLPSVFVIWAGWCSALNSSI